MKNLSKLLIPVSLLLTILAWAPESWAQLRKLYDPQKIVTIQGEVVKLETISRQGRQAANNRKTLIAHLKTDNGAMVVHLGPAEFLAQQQFIPKSGDTLEVTGGRIDTRKGEVILAATIKSGGKTFQLRDARGIPVWSGQTPGCFDRGSRRDLSRS